MKKEDYIRLAFDGDDDILQFFDPTVEVSSLDDIVSNISKKIEEYYEQFDDVKFFGFDGGYVCYCDGFLFSFGINFSKRKSCKLWDIILEKLGGDFRCLLWGRNTRAINWLIKNGMSICGHHEYKGESITELNYTKCH